VICGEYSAHPRSIEAGEQDALREFRSYPNEGEDWEREMTRLFFRYPRRAGGWAKLGCEDPVDLSDLLASAGHRALASLHELLGEEDYTTTLRTVTDLMVTSMPGIAVHQVISPALIPQMLRALLRLPFDCRCQFVVGTSDSGAWAFANAVRAARKTKSTILLAAGQMIPSGYAAQQRIRAVLGKADQAAGLDMLSVGDFLMDTIRRSQSTLSREELRDALDGVRRRKFRASSTYPSAMLSDAEYDLAPSLTTYYKASDVAPACCGAAAVVMTSDEDLVKRICEREHERFVAVPIIEVLGVGEGSSNPNVTYRQSPLTFGSPITQALTAAAMDSGLPMDTYATSAFGVLHDAFPSIELMFLLGIGLDFESALARMRSHWPNPYGGLNVFGHALGASGLVQICKAHHTFCGDKRYALGPNTDTAWAVHTGRMNLKLAFTTSVGGPLSHVVVCMFKGGAEEVESRRTMNIPINRPNLTAEHQERRRAIRDHALDHRRAVEAAGVRYVEGVTEVDLRSCIHTLTHEQLNLLPLKGLADVVVEDHVEKARADLIVRLGMLGRAIRARNANVVSDYDEAIRDLVSRWRKARLLVGDTHGMSAEEVDRRITNAVKRCLRIPVAIVSAESGGARRRASGVRTKKIPPAREVVVLGELEPFLDAEFIEAVDGGHVPVETEPALLPWWHVRSAHRK